MNSPETTDARPLSKLLRLAVLTGISRAVQVHIDRGDDLNARDDKGLTPLMLAAARNKASVCRLLLDSGADGELQDPTGKTAYDIARAAGAHDAASVIEASSIQSPHQAVADAGPTSEAYENFRIEEQVSYVVENREGRDEPPTAVELAIDITEQTLNPEHQKQFTSETLLGEEQAMTIISETAYTDRDDEVQGQVAVDFEDNPEFDLSGWVVEEEISPPTADPAIANIAGAIQAAISVHAPIDTLVEWGDVEAFLPERAMPLARDADTETRAKLRNLLLRAIQEGIASDHEIDELSTNEDGTKNADAREILLMVINDLGAEIDDWMGPEIPSARAGYLEVAAQSPEEENLLEEAFDFIESAVNHRNDPLRTYQREFQNIRLIASEEEIALGQSMERSLDAALDALAAWPLGIARTISAGSEVIAGRRTLASISRGDTESGTDEGNDSVDPDEAVDEVEEESDFSPANQEIIGDTWFIKAIKELESLVMRVASSPSDWEAVRDALGALNLSRGFLLELSDISDPAMPDVHYAYVSAIAEYLKAREAMTCANLKLVFHIAKKYLYSGLSLDDLAQEGNLGLLKAVDKYDWRRGFKFSTYATWWIRQSVSRYVSDKGRTIRVPVHIHEKMQRVRRAADDFEASHGRSAQVDELAELVEMSLQKTRGLMCLLPDTVSLQDVEIDDFIAAGAQDAFMSADPMETASTTELAKAVHGLLDAMEIKESKILRLRFGIGCQEPMTLDEVGKCFGVTRERIRQVESKLLKKLRHAVNFAREAIEVENTIQPKKLSKNRAQEEVAGFLVKNDAVGNEGSVESINSAQSLLETTQVEADGGAGVAREGVRQREVSFAQEAIKVENTIQPKKLPRSRAQEKVAGFLVKNDAVGNEGSAESINSAQSLLETTQVEADGDAGVAREGVRQREVSFAQEAIKVESTIQPKKIPRSRAQEKAAGFLVKNDAVGNECSVESINGAQSLIENNKITKKNLSTRKNSMARVESPIDEIIKLAAKLNMPYIDDRNGSSGQVCIDFIVHAWDARYNKLARMISDNGFKYCSNKRFCK